MYFTRTANNNNHHSFKATKDSEMIIKVGYRSARVRATLNINAKAVSAKRLEEVRRQYAEKNGSFQRALTFICRISLRRRYRRCYWWLPSLWFPLFLHFFFFLSPDLVLLARVPAHSLVHSPPHLPVFPLSLCLCASSMGRNIRSHTGEDQFLGEFGGSFAE